jgi:hypothetical protein
VPDFLRRSYHELASDALTRLVGGIAGEEIIYHEQEHEAGFPLQRHPVAEILRVAARSDGEVRDLPRDQIALSADRSRLLLGGGRIADETRLYVDYVPASSSSPITDIHVGSAARTLVEALVRELALFYTKLERVYRDAFLDTATAEALDQVVALLGVERVRAGSPMVTVSFARATAATSDIIIPAGTIVSTGIRTDGTEVRFATTNQVVLAQGTREVDVDARAIADSEQLAHEITAGAIRIMPRPVAGIERVDNHAPAHRSSRDEADEALRLRTKLALQGAGKVTLDALRSAILDQGALSVVLRDMPRGVPGEVEAFIDLPEYDDETAARAHQDRVLVAVDRTRGAGVRVFTNFARKVYVSIGRLGLVLRDGLGPTDDEKEQLRAVVRRAMTGHVAKLAPGESITRSGLIAAALGDERLREVMLTEVETYQEDRLTRTPDDSESPRRVHDTAIRLLDASGVPVAALGKGLELSAIHVAKDEKAVLVLPGEIEIVARVRRVVHTVIVDVEFRIAPVDPLADRDALRERVLAQRIEPTVRAFFTKLQDGQDVVLAEILELLDSRHYSLENAFLDALYVRDQRVLLGATSVPVADDERAELGELRVR